RALDERRRPSLPLKRGRALRRVEGPAEPAGLAQDLVEQGRRQDGMAGGLVVRIAQAGRAMPAKLLKDQAAHLSRIVQAAEHGAMRPGALLSVRARPTAPRRVDLDVREPEQL